MEPFLHFTRVHGVACNQGRAQLYLCPNLLYGAHAVAHLVEALRYKPEGHGFDS
jgi:hypothetical protein